jgi:diaminopimelate epimerase
MEFTKLQATGNDFILIDARRLEQDWAWVARAMCDRHYGVGADGLLIVLNSEIAGFRMRIFNPDGSEAEVCGNGLRCFARYIIEYVLPDTHELTIETIAGIRKIESCANDRLKVSMGVPKFRPENIPVYVDKDDIIPILDYPINIEGRRLPLSFVSIGNPHAVCFIDDPVVDFPLSELGPIIENHPIFPQRTNFEIVNVLSKREIKSRVWERGVGETLACGSGACAVAVAARLHDYVDSPVDIALPGGTLSIEWDGKEEVYLSGDAKLVFKGEWL